MSRTDKTRPYGVASDDTTLPGYIWHTCGIDRPCDYRPDGNQVNFKHGHPHYDHGVANPAAIGCTRNLHLPLSGRSGSKAWKRLWTRIERREMSLRLHSAKFDPEGFDDDRRGWYRDVMHLFD